MTAIATLTEFASSIQQDVDTASATLYLLDLAQGLVADEIGDLAVWPAVAKSVALAAAGRAYVNPEALTGETVGSTSQDRRGQPIEMGVYLTDGEIARLQRWLERQDASGFPKMGTVWIGSGAVDYLLGPPGAVVVSDWP